VFLSGDGATSFTGLTSQAEAGSSGDAGDLTVTAGNLEVRNGAEVSASTFGLGQGGNVTINAADITSPDSLIEASSEFRVSMDITGLAAPPAKLLDAATLTELCAGRSGANVSSLVVRKYEVLPDSPYALRVQLPRAIPTPRTAKQSRTSHTYYVGGPLPPMISCLGNGLTREP